VDLLRFGASGLLSQLYRQQQQQQQQNGQRGKGEKVIKVASG